MQRKLRLAALLLSVAPLFGNQVYNERHAKPGEFRYSHQVRVDDRWPVAMEISGVLRYDTWIDSRQVVSYRDSLELLYPKERSPHFDTPIPCGNCIPDINAHGNFGMSPILSRIGAEFKSKDQLCHANIKAYVEGDFYGTGNSTAGAFRLRHSYMKFKWEDLFIKLGYTWHPFSNPSTIPNTIGFNSGEPMVPISRVPLAQIGYNLLDCFSLIGTAYSELMFTDDGPQGTSRIYIQNAQRPGLNLLGLFNFPKLLLGLTFDNKELVPRLQTVNGDADDTSLNGWIGSAFARAYLGKFTVRSQVCVGGNSLFLTQIGGYAVKEICDNDKRSYTNIRYWSWNLDADIDFTKTVKPGIFFGLTHSWGSPSDKVYIDPNTNAPIFYGFDSRLKWVYRISPRVWVYKHALHFGFEAEYTKAGFGPMQNTGKINKVDSASNMRFAMTAIYNF